MITATQSKRIISAGHSLRMVPGVVLVIAISFMFGSNVAVAADTVLVLNPYENVDWDRVSHFKINLHTHTTESDGNMSPNQVIDEYHKRGYNGLAITDHNRTTWPWTDFGRDPQALGMVAIPGNELSRHHHTLSLFSNYETDATDIDVALAGVARAGGMATLCHPAMHWVGGYGTPGLRVSLVPVLRSVTRGDFTVAAWFRTTDAGRHILLGNYSTKHDGALNLELHTENRVRVFMQPHGKGKIFDLNISADDLTIDTRDGQWHHLAGVRYEGTVYLYLDGELAGQRTDSAGAFELQGKDFFIGRDDRTGDTALNGDLFQANLWQRALTAEEVGKIVAGVPVSTEGLLAAYACSETVLADAASHPQGPFPAEVAEIAPKMNSDVPDVLQRENKTHHALHFGTGDFPKLVPDAVVENYAALFKRHPYLVGMEILNCTRPLKEYPLDRGLWDGLLTTLMPERPVWGLAVDDMHSIQHMGGNWIVVPADQLDVNTARNALETGRYYFSSIRYEGLEEPDAAGTPIIENVICDEMEKQITIMATVSGKPLADSAYTWVSNGNSIHTGPKLSYGNNPRVGTYARVEIKDAGGISYSNPFGFIKK